MTYTGLGNSTEADWSTLGVLFKFVVKDASAENYRTLTFTETGTQNVNLQDISDRCERG